jgi:adenylate kinase
MVRILLLAPPGAGKGTQGEIIATHYGVPHIATGDLLREEVARCTATGAEAAAYMARGELVPDRLVMTLLLGRIASLAPPVGFVLDGFPRTLSQAEQAYAWATPQDLTFDAVVAINVPEDVLVERVLQRGMATGRQDDTVETVQRRLRIHAETSDALLDFYGRRGILFEVDGSGTVDEVADRIRSHLDACLGSRAEERLDEEELESFPASDPHSDWAGPPD